MTKDVIAIITARGGSKRIPRKNIKLFHGKPIITYPITTAIHSGLFQDVIVSTDDEQIAQISQEAGATIPFMRPASLADDFTPTQDVVYHALQELGQRGHSYTAACCIYPTSVFLTVENLQEGYKKLLDGDFQMVMSVTEFGFPIQRALKFQENGGIAYAYPEHELTRSNDLPERFHDAAQFYWIATEPFLQSKRLFSGKVGAIKIPRKRVVDIDTAEDWQIAERIYTLNNLEDS